MIWHNDTLICDGGPRVHAEDAADGVLAPLFPAVMNLRMALSSPRHDREKLLEMAAGLELRLLNLYNWFEAWEAKRREEIERAADAANQELDRLRDQIAKGCARDVHRLSDPKVRKAVFDLTGGKCAYCDCEIVDGVGQEPHAMCVEHVVPESEGGPNHLTNYVPACRTCNITKRNKHVLHLVRRLQRRPELVVDNDPQKSFALPERYGDDDPPLADAVGSDLSRRMSGDDA